MSRTDQHARAFSTRAKLRVGLALLLTPLPLMAQDAPSGVAQQGVWSDKSVSPDRRASAAVAAMTLDEKLSILSTPLTALLAMGGQAPPGVPISAGFVPGVPRLSLAPIVETDASLGVSNIGEMRKGDVATALPASIALGASFDPDLAYAGGRMIGAEARAKGFGIMLAGGANLVRDPRAGRNFEYVSEDPLLSGVIAGRAIDGIQSNRIVSTLKHFAVNDQETGRFVYNVEMPEAAMRESDLLAFEIANEVGKPGAVMCAYNRVNGPYACDSRYLLTDVLRRDWGFEGFVMSDWGAVHSLSALDAGLDQQSGYQADSKHFFGKELRDGLAAGTATPASVDRAARRVLRSLFAHGVYDAPPEPGGAVDFAAHAAVAQAQAETGIVLLRNEGGILPLTAASKRIVVVGGHADVGVLSGGGSAQVVPVGGVKLAIGKSGGGLENLIKRMYAGTAPLDAIRTTFSGARVEFDDGADPVKAAALARDADVAIVFAEKWFAEGKDSEDLSLEAGQDFLIGAIAKANPRTVVVLQTGNPVLMPWRDDVAAILEAWYPGQRGAEAIARVLAGEVNPSGRLPVTFPAAIEQLPNPRLPGADVAAPPKGAGANPMIDKLPFAYSYPEGADAGYRWFDKTRAAPLYPFGFGLSYTTFDYRAFTASGGKSILATFRVTNTGSREGVDVPQVYVTPPGRAKRLVGWQRVRLAPGETRTLTVRADPRLLADFDVQAGRWKIRQGRYRVELGSSAAGVPAAVREVGMAEAQLSARTGN